MKMTTYEVVDILEECLGYFGTATKYVEALTPYDAAEKALANKTRRHKERVMKQIVSTVNEPIVSWTFKKGEK